MTRSCQPSRPHEVCPRYSGALVSIDDDTLRLQPGRDDPVETLPASEVARLEVRQSSQNVILLGVVMGMVGGMVIGGAATNSDCSNDGGSLPCLPPGFGYGALAGAVAGGVVGALVHPDRWSRVGVAAGVLPRGPRPLRIPAVLPEATPRWRSAARGRLPRQCPARAARCDP